MGTKYTTTTVSGYNSGPPVDDGSQVAANQVKWSTIKTKLPDPLKTAIESIDSKLVTALDVGSRQVTASDNITAADHMKTVEIAASVSGSITVSLGDAATMASGFIVTVKNSSPNDQTIGRVTAADKVNGVSQNLTLPRGCSLTFKVANTASEGYWIEAQYGGIIYDPRDPTIAIVLQAPVASSGTPISNVTRRFTFQNEDGTVALTSEFAYANLDGVDGRMPLPRRYIDGLTYSAPTHSTVTLQVGSARDVSDTTNLILSSALTKGIGAAWAVGTGNGGLDTGGVTNTSWYFIHLIKRSDTGIVDALFSLSHTTPTMPTNYDKRRLVGAVRTDSSGSFVDFQTLELTGGGISFFFDRPTLDVDAAQGVSATSRTLSTPTGIRSWATINAMINNSGADNYLYISSLENSDMSVSAPNISVSATVSPIPTLSALAHASAFSGGQVRIKTNTSSQIRTRSSAASTNLRISTSGWEWNRKFPE